MPGQAFGEHGFPAPGGTKMMLCPPAAAISIQRLMLSCPLTSEKSFSQQSMVL
jgi:hypothetical protein